jgi:hypothetical protein
MRLQGCAPDASKVANCRCLGKEAFGKGQYDQALKHYTGVVCILITCQCARQPLVAAAHNDDHAPTALHNTTEALRWLDQTAPGGSSEACVLHSNRALCFLKRDPPQPAWALQEGEAAVAASPQSFKVCSCKRV